MDFQYKANYIFYRFGHRLEDFFNMDCRRILNLNCRSGTFLVKVLDWIKISGCGFHGELGERKTVAVNKGSTDGQYALCPCRAGSNEDCMVPSILHSPVQN